MIEFSRETDLGHPPAKVWAALTAFEEHRLWNPYANIQRKHAETGAFDYGWRVNLKSRRYIEVTARLVAEEREKLLVFEVRPNFLLTFEERYSLDAIPGGTRLVHSYRCRGPLAALRLPGIRKSFETMLKRIEISLAEHLKRSSRKAPKRRQVHPKRNRRS